MQFARDQASKLEAHEAEKGLFKRLLPIGLAAMKLYCAQRGTGDMGAAITRADGMILPREQKLRGRDYFCLFGKFDVARTCYRTPVEPYLPAVRAGEPPRAVLLVLPARVDDPVLHRAPVQGKRSLVRATLRPRCGRECLDGGGEVSPALLRGLLCAAARSPRGHRSRVPGREF